MSPTRVNYEHCNYSSDRWIGQDASFSLLCVTAETGIAWMRKMTMKNSHYQVKPLEPQRHFSPEAGRGRAGSAVDRKYPIRKGLMKMLGGLAKQLGAMETRQPAGLIQWMRR